MLKGGEVIVLNDEGVQLDTLTKKMIATNTEGEAVELPVKKIRDVQSASADIIVFPEYSGRIDLENQLVIGSKPDSSKLEIALSEVCSVTGQFNYGKYKKMNPKLRVFLLGLSIVGLILIIANPPDLGVGIGDGTFEGAF